MSPFVSVVPGDSNAVDRQTTNLQKQGVIPLQRRKVRPDAKAKPHDRVDDASKNAGKRICRRRNVRTASGSL